jgi:hypothetical protein
VNATGECGRVESSHHGRCDVQFGVRVTAC